MRSLILVLLASMSLLGAGCRLFCDDCRSRSDYEALPTSYTPPR